MSLSVATKPLLKAIAVGAKRSNDNRRLVKAPPFVFDSGRKTTAIAIIRASTSNAVMGVLQLVSYSDLLQLYRHTASML